MQALKTCITVPHSTLVSYTAMDTSPTSDVASTVPHSSLSYKVLPLYPLEPLTPIELPHYCARVPQFPYPIPTSIPSLEPLTSFT